MATVLLVDDDATLTGLLEYALSREGFAVSIAHRGQDALHVVRSESVDLVILDVNLPDANGFALLATIREFSAVPVVMLTGSAREETADRHGVAPDDYVIKPFSVNVFVNRIKGVLQRAGVAYHAHPERQYVG